jgi:NADPH:quinone reductase-like Zn-dependent oxidoreductase
MTARLLDGLRAIGHRTQRATIHPVVDTAFPFESTRDALEQAEKGHAKAGEVVVKIA